MKFLIKLIWKFQCGLFYNLISKICTCQIVPKFEKLGFFLRPRTCVMNTFEKSPFFLNSIEFAWKKWVTKHLLKVFKNCVVSETPVTFENMESSNIFDTDTLESSKYLKLFQKMPYFDLFHEKRQRHFEKYVLKKYIFVRLLLILKR